MAAISDVAVADGTVDSRRIRRLFGPPKRKVRLRLQADLLALLRAANPERLIPMSELIDVLYGGDPEGGPLAAHGCVVAAIHRLRGAGHDIQWINAGSGRMGYRLSSKGDSNV